MRSRLSLRRRRRRITSSAAAVATKCCLSIFTIKCKNKQHREILHVTTRHNTSSPVSGRSLARQASLSSARRIIAASRIQAFTLSLLATIFWTLVRVRKRFRGWPIGAYITMPSCRSNDECTACCIDI